MKSISLKKLSLYSLSLLTLCCMSVANQAQAAETNVEAASVRAKSSRISSSQRTQGIVEGTNIINTFVLAFSAAVRGGGQTALIQQLQNTLTKDFSISLVFGTTVLTATDFNSLQALIQQLGTGTTFDSSLTANISLESITKSRRGRSILQFQALEYVVQTPVSGPSVLLPALDQYTIVQTRCGDYKVSTFVATILTQIPFGTTL